MTPPVAPIDLPWHRRLEARVASALALLVAAAVGAVLLVTVSVVSAQSRNRVAADLDIARATFYRLIDQRIAAAIDMAALVTQLPAFRTQLVGTSLAGPTAALNAAAETQRTQMHAAFAIVARTDGTWLGRAGWVDASGAGVNVVRDAQHAASGGRPTGALIQDHDQLFLVVSVPARAGDEVMGTLTAGFPVTDDIAADLARVARCEVVLVVNGQVVATSLPKGGLDETTLVRATMTRPGVKADVVLNGQAYVAGVFPLMPGIPGGDAGRLLALSNWAATEQFIDSLRGPFALAGLVALLLSAAGGIFLSRHLSRPLRDIATAAAQIAGGNLSLELPVRGSAEAATVAQAFNAMSVSLRAARERLVHDAIHDHLTQLPNRALFKERLDRALVRRKRRKDYNFAVLFVDLDRFKHVNDSLGHTAGDRLLVMFAERLSSAVRADDVVSRMPDANTVPEPTLARFGGDEFAVLLDGIREPFDAVRVAKRVQQMAAEPLSLDGQDVFASASIGVAVATDAHTSGEDIIRDADLAMYRSKNAGAGGYSVFDSALHDMAVRRLRVETDLRRALERDEFRVWYQPIVSLANHKLVGVEALVRWQHPERGLVGPGEFLDVAEEVGLTTQIDAWVLREACRQGQAWRSDGTFSARATVSVNLSAKAFAQESLVQHVLGILRDTGYPAEGLRLEITEGAAIEDAARTRVVLAELRALGVRISLDDFGTGYSSLSYLQSLPLDTLKIDRSFVAGIGTDEDKGEIVKLIVGLGRTLGLEIVAEGTETAAQVEYLRLLGCEFGQGYFFAKPAPTLPPTIAPVRPSRVRAGAAPAASFSAPS